MSSEKCLFTFNSIHQVMKTEEILNSEKIWCDLIPLPRHISTSCGMGVLFLCSDRENIINILSLNNIGIKNFYRVHHGVFELS